MITSPELFINMKGIPDVESSEYHPFFQAELEKIKYGVTINGVYIHGWLYWHLCHWNIFVDKEDPKNKADIIRNFQRPALRDNEWLIAEYLKKAEDQKKGLMIFGSRRLGKSEFEASWLGRGATIYEGSENVLAGTNEADIKVLASKLDKGLNAVHPYFRFERLQDDWRKEVTLGYKAKKRGGERLEWSKIWIRNLDEGKNTEAIAGTTPKTMVIDEVGKHNWLEAFEAAKPGFTSPYGWRCVPILTGTGGTFEPNSDAQKVFTDPETYNFIPMEWPGKVRKYGVFIPGTFRMEGKVSTKFGEFVERKSGIVVPANSELNLIEFLESDPVKAKKVTDDEIKVLENSSDPKPALKARMYYPNDPDDCFLNAETNQFPIQAIEQHLAYLEEMEAKQGFVGQAVELYRDVDGKVKFTAMTKLKEIRDFPVTSATIKDAPVIMYEPPADNPPYLLYIAGSDPYNVSTSDNSPSLGTMCIYKRLYDPVNGTFQNMIVASIASRPPQMKDWNKTMEMLLELYNATCMIENAGTNFIEYMDGKHKGHMLADGYNIVQQVSPNTSIKNRPKGLPPTPRVINHCMALAYDYANEDIDGVDESGKPVKRLGVTRIMDRMLLVEMKNYTADGNFDRLVAFRHALAYDNHLQKISPLVKFNDGFEDVIPKAPIRTVASHTPFISGKSMFNKGHNPFR
jgi:hypothetical protein